MQVFLDGIPVTHKTLSLMKPVITWRKKDEEGAKAFSFSGDIAFYGTDYDYIKSKLWDNFDSNGANVSLQTEVKLKFVDDCCDFPVEFRITGESIKWCEGSCEVTCAAIETSPEEEAIRCVRNTLIDDNTASNWPDNVAFKNRRHPRFSYCNEIRPRWFHVIIMQWAVVTAIILQIIVPIYAIVINLLSGINNLINQINNLLGTNIKTITFKDDPGQTPFQEGQTLVNNILSNVIGCGRKHPSPLVRDYIQNVCGKCGLTFSSSIFNSSNSDYFNTAYFNAPVDKGIPVSDNSTFWIESNKPIRSGEQFLNDICSIVNGKWEVKSSVLSLERIDVNVSSVPFIDTTQLDSDSYSVCYSWSKKTRAAYGVFQYQQDAINTVGAEVVRRWSDIVEWNSPPLPNQKGEFKPLFNFAACRFIGDNIRMSDGADKDIYSIFQGAPFLSQVIAANKEGLILNQHVCSLPMLLIWDGNDIVNAKVSGSQFVPASTDPNFPAFANNSEATPGEYFNYPFWFDATIPNNLYDRFWAIENPRFSGFQGKSLNLQIELTCENVLLCDLDGCVKTTEGISKEITAIEFNYATKLITITAEI